MKEMIQKFDENLALKSNKAEMQTISNDLEMYAKKNDLEKASDKLKADFGVFKKELADSKHIL